METTNIPTNGTPIEVSESKRKEDANKVLAAEAQRFHNGFIKNHVAVDERTPPRATSFPT